MINKEETVSLLQKLKLHGMAAAYAPITMLAAQQQPSAHDLVAQLALSEQNYREEKKAQTYVRMSKLRYDSILQHVYCSDERNFSKDQLMAIADCNFINQCKNILITGATGCGKSYLACAIGKQACTLGYRTIYYGMVRFAEGVVQAKLEGNFTKFLDQVNKNHLLIIDDFGIFPINNDVRLSLLQILEDRYQKKATIIVSQLPLNKWYDYINDNTLADAIMDRLSASAHLIELKGKSLRNRKIEKKF